MATNIRWIDNPVVDPLDGTEEMPVTQGGDDKKITVQQLADANESRATAIASAATTDIGAAEAPFLHVTGTTTITALGTVQAGTRRIVVFDGVLILTHNATSLILPTGANITTAAGDVATFVSEGAGNWKCVDYTRANGTPLAAAPTAFASIGVQFEADLTSTADSDPGPGLMRWNNATQGSATELYLDDNTVDGASLTGFWSALVAGGFAYLQHATDQDVWQIWEITGITDESGYATLGVTLLSAGDAFAEDDPVQVTLQQGATIGPGGDVVGPASATADAVALFDGTTGKLLKDGITIASIRTMPQNSQSSAYTLVASDAGGHVYHPSADTTARTWTIPANSSVPFPIGTAVTFINDTGAGVITLAITTDTLVLAGAGTTGSRTLGPNGVATAIKVTSTRWIVNGVGLT